MDYSNIKSIGAYQYRYNYETEELEQLGRKVRKVEEENGCFPVVIIEVLNSIKLKSSQYEKEPDYWIQLFDSQISS